jgi:hypothetical protein
MRVSARVSKAENPKVAGMNHALTGQLSTVRYVFRRGTQFTLI